MKKKKIIIIVACILVLWIAIGVVDYNRVDNSNKPLFCVGTELADDGGSGRYVGLGYSFDIGGHLDGDGKYEIDTYTYKVFGITIKIVHEPLMDPYMSNS